MEHTLHLASKAFIEEIIPTPSWYKKKKLQETCTKGDVEEDEVEEDDDKWDDEVAWLASFADDAPAVEGEEIDKDMNTNHLYPLKTLIGSYVNDVISLVKNCNFWSKDCYKINKPTHINHLFYISTICSSSLWDWNIQIYIKYSHNDTIPGSHYSYSRKLWTQSRGYFRGAQPM